MLYHCFFVDVSVCSICVSTNVGCNVHSSVGTLPPNTPTYDDSGTVQEPVSLTNGEPMASFQGSIHTSTCSHTQDLKSPTQNLESCRQSLSALRLKQEQVKHHTKLITLHPNQQSFRKGFKMKLPVQVPKLKPAEKNLISPTEIGTKLRDLILKHCKSLADTIEAKIKKEHVQQSKSLKSFTQKQTKP